MVSHDKYANSPRRAYAGVIDDLGDDGTDVRLALMNDSFTVDLEGDEVWADVSAAEIDEEENDVYSAGGNEVAAKSLTQAGAVVTFDGDDVVWPESTITASFAVLYNATPADDAEKDLLTVIDFEGEEISENGDFRVEWDDAGIFEVNTQP